MSSQPKLVIGANGFLGSHVTRQLVSAGHDVRVMVRENASTVSIDDLDVQRFVGDIWDDDTLRCEVLSDEFLAGLGTKRG